MVLRPLIERPLRPLLYGLAGATFVNLLLSVVAGLPLVYRLLFLVQMFGAALFFIWFLRSGRELAKEPSKPQMRRAAVAGARLGLALTVFAFAANVFGFVSLSRLIGGALITSAYLGVLLDTSVHVMDALLLGASHIRPLTAIGMVQRHRPLLLRRLHVLFCVLAIWLWAFFTLDALSIRTAVMTRAEAVWAWPKDVDEVFRTPAAKAVVADTLTGRAGDDDTPDGVASPTTAPAAVAPVPLPQPAASPAEPPKGDPGTLSNTLYVGGVISFALTLIASYYVARFIAFLLDEDIYPRLHLARGIPYAISTLLRYVVLAVGFTLAIAKLGYNDLTQLTILVSAFGVGLGFGMQNIVNNFVSGLILLFERPVQVGDVIELDNFTGVVSRIGIRASVVRTALASEIIVPNGRLISDRVINWTLSNRQRGVELSITFEAGPDPQKIIALLVATAKSLPMVAAYPSPQAFFTDFAGGGLKFEVRAWTNRFEDWAQVRSELAVAINAMVVKEELKLK
jgi:small-conductance mechanosensitive channel